MPVNDPMLMNAVQRTFDDKINGVLSSLTQAVRTENFILNGHSLYCHYFRSYHPLGLLQKMVFTLDPTNPEIMGGVSVRVQQADRVVLEAPLSIGSGHELWLPTRLNDGVRVDIWSQRREQVHVSLTAFEYICDFAIARNFVTSEDELLSILASVRFVGPRRQNQISQESLEQFMAMQRRASEDVSNLGESVRMMSEAIVKHLHEDHGKPLISQPPIGRTGNRVVS